MILSRSVIFFGSVVFSVSGLCGCVSSQQETLTASEIKQSALYSEEAGICQERNSSRMWQVEKGETFSSLRAAESYAENLELGGYDDWRLPTREELLQLHKIFFWKKNGNCSMNQKGDYWYSSGSREYAIGRFETQYLFCGPEFKFVESRRGKGYVRAVRP